MLIEIEQHDRYCILRCKGRFVAGPEMEYMQTKMEDIKRLACIKVLADFQDVAAIGSMGVAFIVGVYTSVIRKPCGRFRTGRSRSPHTACSHLTGLGTVIPQASDLASGLALLRRTHRWTLRSSPRRCRPTNLCGNRNAAQHPAALMYGDSAPEHGRNHASPRMATRHGKCVRHNRVTDALAGASARFSPRRIVPPAR